MLRKTPRLLLGEDALGRERAEDSMQGVRIGPDLVGQLLDRLRPVGESLGDVQVGRDRERARREWDRA